MDFVRTYLILDDDFLLHQSRLKNCEKEIFAVFYLILASSVDFFKLTLEIANLPTPTERNINDKTDTIISSRQKTGKFQQICLSFKENLDSDSEHKGFFQTVSICQRTVVSFNLK